MLPRLPGLCFAMLIIPHMHGDWGQLIPAADLEAHWSRQDAEDCVSASVTFRKILHTESWLSDDEGRYGPIPSPCKWLCAGITTRTFLGYWGPHARWFGRPKDRCLLAGELCVTKRTAKLVQFGSIFRDDYKCVCEARVVLRRLLKKDAVNEKWLDCSVVAVVNRLEVDGWLALRRELLEAFPETFIINPDVSCQKPKNSCGCNWAGKDQCEPPRPIEDYEASPFDITSALNPNAWV